MRTVFWIEKHLPHISVGGHSNSRTLQVCCHCLVSHRECNVALMSSKFPWVIEVVAEGHRKTSIYNSFVLAWIKICEITYLLCDYLHLTLKRVATEENLYEGFILWSVLDVNSSHTKGSFEDSNKAWCSTITKSLFLSINKSVWYITCKQMEILHQCNKIQKSHQHENLHIYLSSIMRNNKVCGR